MLDAGLSLSVPTSLMVRLFLPLIGLWGFAFMFDGDAVSIEGGGDAELLEDR